MGLGGLTHCILFIAEPPSAPVITGLPENQALREGQMVVLTCSSNDGSPKPDLNWYRVRGDGSDETKLVSDISNTPDHSNGFSQNDGSIGTLESGTVSVAMEQSQSTIMIVSSREDNNRLYR